MLEKYLSVARHIEVQVMADTHGHCIHLWERECSIQRRHQKVIEEAPSPVLSSETRMAMGEVALQLLAQIGYVSAGTMEIPMDFDPNEADEIAEEIKASALTARGIRKKI